MESPDSGEVELPSSQPSIVPSNSSSSSASTLPTSAPSTSTPHYIISAQDITADRDSPLGTAKRTGSVFKGLWNNSIVAVTVLSNETPVDSLFDRIQKWQSLRHPHVLQVFGVSAIDADPPFIISQYNPNGSANEFLAKNPGADRAKISELGEMFECALGMQYLHGRGIVHGNLKPTNILISENGQACISDYGMVELKPGSGCARYFSPEAWKGAISQPSDVFAFGMSSYEIFTSTPPWGVLSENHIYQLVVRENDRPDRPEPNIEQKYGLTGTIWKIIEASWHKEATLRPTFVQIVNSWQMWSSEHASASGQLISGGNSQSTLHNIRLWQSHQNDDDSSSTASTLPAYRMPPAYPDISSRRPHTAPSFSPPGSLLDIRTRNTDVLVRPGADNNLGSFNLPLRSTSRSGNADSVSLSMPTIPDTDTSTPLSSDPLLYHRHQSSLGGTGASTSTIHSSDLSRMPTISEGGLDLQYHPYRLQSSTTSSTLSRNPTRVQDTNRSNQRRFAVPVGGITSDSQSVTTESQRGASSKTAGRSNAVLLAGALHAEVTEGRKQEVIDDYLLKVQFLSSQSDKEAQKLVTAGIVPTVILLLKARAVDAVGLEIVLVTLGILACDPITANTIHRTNTTTTIIAIINSADSYNTIAVSIWCLNRICRSSEVATALIKQDLAGVLMRKGLKGNLISSRLSAWCLGTLAYTDDLAENLAALGAVTLSAEHLRYVTAHSDADTEDTCAAIYLVSRLARTTTLAKSLAKAGCVMLIVHHLSVSEDPQVLHWSARAVGCLQRPSASDMAKALLDAGSAKALARLPRVLPSDVIEPLASFAFAIQRLSCAEWGGGTRKALVEAGVVDSLLSALRTSADIPNPQVHIELALATSFLGDVGGTAIRKEIVRAGGIEILKRVGAAGKPEVAKACNMAVTSITGNLWTRNAASAKTAMAHNWNGGCPEYQPECPFVPTVD